MILRPTKTIAGRQATFNARANGSELVLTHMSIGDVGGPIDDQRTRLRSERERVMAFGRRENLDQIHLDSLFNGPAAFWVRELGIWADTTLVYYWSTAGAELGYKATGTDWLLGLDLQINPVADSQLVVNAAPPNVVLSMAPHLATVLQSLADTNRLLLSNLYLK